MSYGILCFIIKYGFGIINLLPVGSTVLRKQSYDAI